MGLGKFWFLLLWTWSALATDAAQDLAALLARQASFSAQFDQVVTSNKGEILEQRQGELDIARPGKLYWEDDHGQVVVANGKTVYIYFKNLNQLQKHNQDTLLKYSPASLLLRSAKDIAALYQVRHFQHEGEDLFSLHPRSQDGLVHRLQIGFAHGVLHKFEITDWNYGLISIYLKNLHPKTFPPSRFEFMITPDMEVLEQSA